MPYLALFLEGEVRSIMMRRTISGMIGTGSLAHNRRDFIAENVDPDRVHLNICYQNENLKEVYKELFDDSVERYNVGKRKDRQITNYYEKIRQGKQEKLFHEVIFQIGNREDMAVGTTEGDLAVKVLDEYVKNFQQRNPTLHVFSCYLHQDEATPHLHIDFVPYVTGWKGKGMDTRISLKQALKSLGFQGGNKHDTELNQWINHEKELLAEIARQHGIEWEQKGTHEEHLDVYNFKKKERKKEVQALEQEKEYLTAEKEGLTAQIAEVRADIQLLKDDKEQAVKDKEEAEKRAEKAEKDLYSLEERRERLQPVMDNVSKEIKEYGTVKTLLSEAGALERATTYRDKKIKPLFIQMKNKIAAMAVQVKELTKEVEKWKHKYQETKQVYNRVQRELDTVRQEKQQLQDVSDRYDRVVRILGENVVEDAVQQDIQEQKALEENGKWSKCPKEVFTKDWPGVPVKVRGRINSVRKIKQKTEEWRDKIMKKHIYDESNGLSYTLHGDYYLPDLAVNEEEPTYGKYGMLRKQFLKEHRPTRYQYLVMTGELTAHLNRVDQEARELVEILMNQMTEKQGVTEQLKIQDQMKWVGLMNNIKACAEEIVLQGIVYM